ncbi:hypothetical protein [Citricoccus alkalitolerans]|uniref:Uncharacterized protein n=1 Tax=Citricoccus alkalitolerans TaxID=246603 RepID=A0ABV8Y0L0_9MICC
MNAEFGGSLPYLTVAVLVHGIAAVVWEFIPRIDGVKMLVLAGLIAVVQRGNLPRRVALTALSAGACLALLLSGIGYLALNPLLMESAAASLPLLLIWALVATAGPVAGDLDAGESGRSQVSGECIRGPEVEHRCVDPVGGIAAVSPSTQYRRSASCRLRANASMVGLGSSRMTNVPGQYN